MLKQLLRVTHLERGEGGWYIRFTGEEYQFNRMKNDLKGLSRYCAKWTPTVKWPDGKIGAWWITQAVINLYADRFVNLDIMLKEVNEAENAARQDAGNYFDEEWYSERYGHDDPYTSSARHKSSTTSSGAGTRKPFTPPHVVIALNQLGFTELPTRDELKKTYRKLAMKYHPDTNGGADGTFKRLNNANATVLKWLDTTERVNTSWGTRSA